MPLTEVGISFVFLDDGTGLAYYNLFDCIMFLFDNAHLYKIQIVVKSVRNLMQTMKP